VKRSAMRPRQWRLLLILTFSVIAVVGVLSGYIRTSIANLSPSSREEQSGGPGTSLPTSSGTADSPVSGPSQATGIEAHVRAARVFNQIQHQVEILRDLPRLMEVPLTFPTREEMALLLRRLYEGRGWDARLEPYMVLGLLGPADALAGPRATSTVYVPEQGQIYVTNGSQERSADDQALVVHAYAHALQSQHFGSIIAQAKGRTTDESLALEGLFQGDALLAAGLYRYGGLEAADWDHLGAVVLQAEQPSYGERLDSDPAVDRLAHFPNWEGRQFVQVLYESGGWEAVNRAYADPPRSTEHILHPERYGQSGSEPADVLLPDLAGPLGEDWTLILEDTFGEFVMGLYLGRTLPEERAWQSVDGWCGDAFVLWQHEDGRELWLWRSVWDSTTEAAEFESAVFTIVPHGSPPVMRLEQPDGLDGRWYETGEGTVYIGRVGRYVVWMVAPDLATAVTVAESLP
jgi:hypothetical protein